MYEAALTRNQAKYAELPFSLHYHKKEQPCQPKKFFINSSIISYNLETNTTEYADKAA